MAVSPTYITPPWFLCITISYDTSSLTPLTHIHVYFYKFILLVGTEYVETTIAGRTRTWLADQYYIGGSEAGTDPNQTIANTNHPQVYRTERYGQFQYEIPLPIGNYEIILHFAETYVLHSAYLLSFLINVK